MRAPGIPSEVGRQDAATRGRDDMLATWIADRGYVLERECKAQRDKTSPPAPAGFGRMGAIAADTIANSFSDIFLQRISR